MPQIVPNRPPCKHCNQPIRGPRCAACGRWNLLRFLTSGFMARY